MEKLKKFLDRAAEIALIVYLWVMAIGGFIQFTIVSVATLFGTQFHWLQYVASVVLVGYGYLCLWAATHMEYGEN